MPDLIRHPVQFWIPAFAGMTSLTYIIAGVITVWHQILTERKLKVSVEFSEQINQCFPFVVSDAFL